MTKRDRLQESLSLCCAFEEEKNTKEKEKMYVLWCRLFQRVMKFFMHIVTFWRKPKMITGRDSLKKLPGIRVSKM